MEADKILAIVLREMTAYGYGWRLDWNDFDGRTLRNQLNSLNAWATDALDGKTDDEYTDGTTFFDSQGS